MDPFFTETALRGVFDFLLTVDILILIYYYVMFELLSAAIEEEGLGIFLAPINGLLKLLVGVLFLSEALGSLLISDTLLLF